MFISVYHYADTTHRRRTACTRAWRCRSRRPAGRVAAALYRWPTGTDGNESGTARETLSAPGVPFRCPRSGRSHPSAPLSRPSACRAYLSDKKIIINIIYLVLSYFDFRRFNTALCTQYYCGIGARSSKFNQTITKSGIGRRDSSWSQDR